MNMNLLTLHNFTWGGAKALLNKDLTPILDYKT